MKHRSSTTSALLSSINSISVILRKALGLDNVKTASSSHVGRSSRTHYNVDKHVVACLGLALNINLLNSQADLTTNSISCRHLDVRNVSRMPIIAQSLAIAHSPDTSLKSVFAGRNWQLHQHSSKRQLGASAASPGALALPVAGEA